jgi:hypothetical protein
MDRPRERAFSCPVIDHRQKPPELVALALRGSKVGLSWIYRAMRKTGNHSDESRYYEKL